jgi:hypothetical protein
MARRLQLQGQLWLRCTRHHHIPFQALSGTGMDEGAAFAIMIAEQLSEYQRLRQGLMGPVDASRPNLLRQEAAKPFSF